MGIKNLFANYKYTKIALYGLGTETEKVLKEFAKDYEIVGLLDGFQENGELYGKSIISLDDAIKKEVKLIIVVARPSSCRAIAKRIGNICRKNEISVMDVRGRNLLSATKVVYDFSNTEGMTRVQLTERIKEADVVSFDLFDTLVMRQTLLSDDVIKFVDCRLQNQGIYIQDFYKRRLASEKELSRYTAPTLTEIYNHMFKRSEESSSKWKITAEQLADLEWNIDFDLIVARKEVCDILKETVANGKRAYIVSDTYYSRQQLAEILKQCGIVECTDILASSDYRTGKTQNLFSILKERENGKKILHIGDDIVADIECAHKFEIETCRLFSGFSLLELMGNLGFADYMDTLSEHLKIGMFVAKIFNSPFQFETENKRITISDIYDVGYLLCAPMISDFVLWFYSQVKQQKLKNIWFCARDGYLIKKMYEYLMKMYKQEDKSVYFLVSRTAAVRAGVQDEADIQYVDEMKFSGTLKENLKERFGIDIDEIDCENILDNENGLLKYKKEIIEKSNKLSENYQKYINGLNIEPGDIAFFDFVARGTSQMYIQRLTDNHLRGFYFLQLDSEHMKNRGLDIRSFYSEKTNYAVFDNYYIFEPLLTAPHPSVKEFDKEGQPIYAAETRCDKDIRCFERAQDGILDYFKTYIKLCPESEKVANKKLDEAFLKLIHEIKITDIDFQDLVVEDPFFNRMTNVTDII